MKKDCKIMRWKKMEDDTIKCRIACHHFSKGAATYMHCHDFTEVFWSISGEGFHELNGIKNKIGDLELFLLGPGDMHNVSSCMNSSFVFNNLAFPSKILEGLEQKYHTPLLTQWQFRDKSMPLSFKISPVLLQWLNTAIQELYYHKENVFYLDYFLINMIYELEKNELELYQKSSAPKWLEELCKKMNEKKNFSRGVKALNLLSGYTQEYTARELKKYTGKTPTEYINEIRLQHAAMLLATTSTPIGEIAFETGFESLSYFYKIFKKQFKLTPRIYKKRNQSMLTLQK